MQHNSCYTLFCQWKTLDDLQLKLNALRVLSPPHASYFVFIILTPSLASRWQVGVGWGGGGGEGLIFTNTRPLEKSLQCGGKNWEFMIPFSSDNSSSTFWTIAPPGLFKALITVVGGGGNSGGAAPNNTGLSVAFSASLSSLCF